MQQGTTTEIYTDQEDAPPCPNCDECLIEPFVRQWAPSGAVVVECCECGAWVAINETPMRVVWIQPKRTPATEYLTWEQIWAAYQQRWVAQ